MNTTKLILVLLLVVISIIIIPSAWSSVFGYQQSGETSATTNPSSLGCQNQQRCREIDDAWKKIGSIIHSFHAAEIWHNGWKRYEEVYQPGVSGFPPTTTGLCFPIARESFKENKYNFGNARRDGSRCHAGIDMYTQGEGRIIAIDDGEVINIHNFLSDCDAGPADALLIHHPTLQGGITINYGEMNRGQIAVKEGQHVTRGQYLGIAKTCSYGGSTMLHLEMYQGKVSSTKQWENLPGVVPEGNANYCVVEPAFLAVKPPELLNPTDLVKSLEGKFCDGTIPGS